MSEHGKRGRCDGGRFRKSEETVPLTSEIYRDIILDYYRHPRNYGELADADVRVRDTNPLCGDVVEMQLKIRDGRIIDARFTGSGCAISQAAASMLTEAVAGKTLDEAKALEKQYVLETLIGVDPGPTRTKCALLGLKALKLAVYAYLGQAKTEADKTQVMPESENALRR